MILCAELGGSSLLEILERDPLRVYKCQIKSPALKPGPPVHGICTVIEEARACSKDVLVLASSKGVVPGMIVSERWLHAEGLGMRIHGRKAEGAKVSAPGTGAGDLPVSDAVRGGSLVGWPIIPMGFEPAVVSGRPATHPVEL